MVLAVEGLSVQFRTEEGAIDAVRQVSFDIAPGEILCLVGESGSGKSVTSLALMGLLPQPTGRVAAGRARFAPPGIEAVDLLSAGERVVRRLRGDRIAMVFQDPMTSLNPYLRVGAQLDEVLIAHQALSPAEAKRRSVTMLDEVGLNEPERRHRQYPHELSGGMRQRVAIAMALLCEPDLLIADEPTTALDVTIQLQILDLLRERRDERVFAVLFITHDLGVVAELADRVAVMYAGRVVEMGTRDAIFAAPRHPYTRALLDSVPRFDGTDDRHLPTIEGSPPVAGRLGAGCAFRPRCGFASEACGEEPPARRDGGRRWRCHHPLEGEP